MKTFCLCLLAAVSLFGCSSDTPTQTSSFPLTLALIGAAQKDNTTMYFTFQVTKNGTGLKGAQLSALKYGEQKADTIKNLTSNDTGAFNFQYPIAQRYLFQAFKDSLV